MRSTFVVLLASLLASCGCSGGPKIAKVSGRVTVAGKPLTTGQIMFHTELGRPAQAQLEADGRYTLTTFQPGDGAIVGDHIVTIQATKVGAGSMGYASLEDEMRASERGEGGGKILIPGKVEWLVPESYSQPRTSKLRATVKDEPNEINFDIEK